MVSQLRMRQNCLSASERGSGRAKLYRDSAISRVRDGTP